SGHQRGHAEANVERQDEDGSPGHENQVGGKLHQRLCKEDVQFVGIVVDSGDEIAGLVLIEEIERKLLQLREDRIAQLVEHLSADAAHGLRLHVARDEADQV